MILVLQQNHTTEEKDSLLNAIRSRGGVPLEQMVQERVIVTFSGSLKSKLDFLAFPVVDKALSLQNELKHSALEARGERSRVSVGNLEFGPGKFYVIAGPCSIENDEQYMRLATLAKKAGAHALRGGAFKPRTSPYTFQGLGRSGLEILEIARKELELPIITEALDVRDVELVAAVTDVIQVGSRNMQNFPLLKEVGKMHKPVLLKRGLAATIHEWLLAAEYIMEAGNSQVILCERGVRSFDTETRNCLDIAAVPVVQQKSHLPIIVDPSHGLGRREFIEPMAQAALAAGAHGVMIEIHDQPETALSDGFQAIHPTQLASLTSKLKRIGTALDIFVP